jgi:serine protease inhibitor
VDTGTSTHSADTTSVEGEFTKHDSDAKLLAVNRPFVVIIYHKFSKGILFVGACKTL